LKNAVFGDVAACRSCVNRRFGGTYRLHFHGRKIRERGTSVIRWLQSSAICSSETSVHTRSTRHHIPEDGILHRHSRENLKSYSILTRLNLNYKTQYLDSDSGTRPLNFSPPSGFLCQGVPITRVENCVPVSCDFCLPLLFRFYCTCAFTNVGTN
jgi:hypothetical protein